MHNLRRKVSVWRTQAGSGKISWGLDARLLSRATSRAHLCNCRTTVSRAPVAGMRWAGVRAPSALDFEAVFTWLSNRSSLGTVKGSRASRALR